MKDLSPFPLDENLGMEIAPGLDDLRAPDPGLFVLFNRHGLALHDILEADFPVVLGEKRKRVGIPLAQGGPLLDLAAIVHQELGAHRDGVTVQFATLGVLDHDVAVP